MFSGHVMQISQSAGTSEMANSPISKYLEEQRAV